MKILSCCSRPHLQTQKGMPLFKGEEATKISAPQIKGQPQEDSFKAEKKSDKKPEGQGKEHRNSKKQDCECKCECKESK